MKQSAAYAAIRQIATLGYPADLVLPTLLVALRDVVGFDSANFMWLDEGHNVVQISDPDVVPQKIMSCYLEQFSNSLENEDIASNRDLVDRLDADRTALHPQFTRSVLFNELMRPAGYRYFLRLAIRNGTQPVGILNLLRTPGTHDFSRKDDMRLASIRPWLTHALVAPAKLAAKETLIEDKHGLIIADGKGKPLFFSRGAKALLHRAAGAPVDRLAVADHHGAVRTLIRRLVLALDESDSSGSGAPTITVANAAGTFVLRAYWMEGAAPGAGRNIAVQIQRQVPLPLRLMQSQRLRRLPPREQQACLLLAQGFSSAEVARRMGISRDGAVYHVRSFYNRFGISRQEELLSAILRPDVDAVPPDLASYPAG